MLLVGFLVVALLLVPVFRGRLSALAEFGVERSWLLAAVLAIQVVIVSVLPGTSGWILPAGHILSYALLMWFLIVNREVAGLWLISLGAAMNAVAITANGGVMPAHPAALKMAGRMLEAGAFENSNVLVDPQLLFLGDVFVWPAPLPLHNVFSPGDVCIVAGTFVLVHFICGSRLAPGARTDVPRLLPIKPL